MLARHRCECVVIGGYAAVLAGIAVVTRDIDITPATDQANLERLADALDELHAAIRVRPGEPPVPLPADARLLARTEILNLTTDAGDLDITTRPDGTGGYNDLKRGARTPAARQTGCTSRSPRSRTSSAARPPPGARKTSPLSPSCGPPSSASLARPPSRTTPARDEPVS